MSRFATMLLVAACLALGTAHAADTPQPADADRPAARERALGADDPRLQWMPCPPLFAPGCQIAVLHGDPSKSNADVFFRIPAGYVIPPHSHTSAEHLVLVSGELDVHYKGQPKVAMRTGDYAYGPPGLPHLGHCVGKVPCTLFIAFEQPVDAFGYDGAIP